MGSFPPPNSYECIERLFASMGTLVRFQVYHESKQVAIEAISEAARLIQRIHNLMSVQETNSQIARWNRSAKGLDEPFHPLTASALDEALSISRHTGGRFDPTIGAVVTAFDDGISPIGHPARIGSWDAANRRFQKIAPFVCLDLGGSAKGWTVDQAMEVLRRHGVSSALVNAGGDLRVIGAPPEADAWDIGIRDPRMPDEVLAKLALRDSAVANSGDYENGGAILVDPRDFTRVRLNGSVSVIAPTCGAADGLSTALCVEQDFAILPDDCQAIVARTAEEGLSIETTSNVNLLHGSIVFPTEQTISYR